MLPATVLHTTRHVCVCVLQDTKPHREIPLSQILDALEYDLPSHRSNPSAPSPPLASPPPQTHGFSVAAEEAEAYGLRSQTQTKQAGTHTFKVVTTKRTLLLCAPSEEEEIKWLSAVRALIARRSGAGVVPGDVDGIAHAAVLVPSKQPILLPNPSGGAASSSSPSSGPPVSEGPLLGMGGGPGVGSAAIAPASGAGVGGGTGVVMTGSRKRGDSFVRRLSLSGGAMASSSSSTAAGAGSGGVAAAGGGGTIASAGTVMP